jgi:hypothetical protein
MASLANRIKALARSPQGKRVIARAERELSKPANQEKLRRLSERLRSRGGRRY